MVSFGVKTMPANDELLIAQLAAGQSYDAAAQAAGVSKSTIIRRMKTPAFRGKVRQARALALEMTLGNLSIASAEAAITLRLLLHSRDEKVRLHAARVILAAERSFLESEELMADVEELKAQVAALRKVEKKRSTMEQRRINHERESRPSEN